MLKVRGRRSEKSNWPPCAGCIGGTLSGFTKALDYATPQEVKTEYYLTQPINTGP